MTLDIYADFAERYELFYKSDPNIETFFAALFAKYQIKTVLDCACGTGRELMLFDKLGCRAIGSDLSDAMLAQARCNLTEASVDIPLHKADFRELPQHFFQHFDAVVCWSAAIIHVPNDDEALRAFRSMYSVLNAGGILILDQGITDKRWNDKNRFVLNRSSADISRLYAIDYTGKRNCRYHVLDIFHQADRKELKVWSTDTHVLLKDDQEKLLKTAGFKSIDFFGTYDFGPYEKATSLRLIAIAQK